MASTGPNDETVPLELPAPSGWKKMIALKKGGTPSKNATVFTSPTGEEITNVKQLKQYLKANPGGPKISEFDWTSGETPRRSSRISEKEKSTPPPDPEPVKKRSRKSTSSKKGKKETKEDEENVPEEKDVEMKEKDDGKSEITETPLKDVEMKDLEKGEEGDEKPKEEDDGKGEITETPLTEEVAEPVKGVDEETCEIPKIPSEEVANEEETKNEESETVKEVNEEVSEIPEVPLEEVAKPEEPKAEEIKDGENEPLKEVVEEVCEIPKMPLEEELEEPKPEETKNEGVLENPITPPPEKDGVPATKVAADGGAVVENGCPEVEKSEAQPSWEEIKIE